MSLPTLVLVDDHTIIRQGLKSLITNEKIAHVIGEASNGREFLDLLDSKIPDIVLMDINMPVMDGIEATRLGIEKVPGLKVIAFTMYGEKEYYYKMVEAGVKGFLIKTCGLHELEKAIRGVAAGECFFSSELLREIINEFGKNIQIKEHNLNKVNLSHREIDVLRCICEGLTNEEIAIRLHISPKTVKGHRANLLEKTACRNAPSLVIYAIKNKLFEI
jgi:DNA-binding NarL/FixJ family response regulator